MPPRPKKTHRKKIVAKKGGRLAKHHKSKHTKKGGGVDWKKTLEKPGLIKASTTNCFGKGIADLHKKAVEFLNSSKGKDILGKAAGYVKDYAPKVVTAAKDYRAKYGRPPKK